MKKIKKNILMFEKKEDTGINKKNKHLSPFLSVQTDSAGLLLRRTDTRLIGCLLSVLFCVIFLLPQTKVSILAAEISHVQNSAKEKSFSAHSSLSAADSFSAQNLAAEKPPFSKHSAQADSPSAQNLAAEKSPFSKYSAQADSPSAQNLAAVKTPFSKNSAQADSPSAQSSAAAEQVSAAEEQTSASSSTQASASTQNSASAQESEDAESMWSEDFYRAVDSSGRLSKAEEQNLDEECLDFMKNWHVDLGLVAVTSDRYDKGTLSAYAKDYYDECGFGYGPGKDGFQMIWDTETDEVLIEAFGAAKDLIPESYLTFVSQNVVKFREKYGIYGPFYATTRYLNNYLEKEKEKKAEKKRGAVPSAEKTSEKSSESSKTASSGADERGSSSAAADVTDISDTAGMHETLPDGEIPDESLRIGEGSGESGKPAWYPKDPGTFPYYHDAKAPRVIDRADIFTDSEEAMMEERLSELRPFLEKDLVIFTDSSTYGLSHESYAEDFFDFNGYGYGDDYEGACLMVCMDPDDRGWWCACSGPVTMRLYTENAANQIDDILYDYMRDGNYGEGVLDWIENFRRLYQTGSPYSEEWALQSEDSFARFHDTDASRVLDEAGLLTNEEIEELRRRALELSEKYELDVVIHTVRSEGILPREEYGRLFFLFNGYGFGENYDGIQLTIFKRPGYMGAVSVDASGNGLEKLTEVNKKRLKKRCTGPVENKQYFRAASQWLDQTEQMLRAGRAPRSRTDWILSSLPMLLAGLIFGKISLSRAKERMMTLKVQEYADLYVVWKSLRIQNVEDKFLYNTVNKTYSPVPRESSSTSSRSHSSGGSSSYSSPHTSSSSGRSHSGSGRRF